MLSKLSLEYMVYVIVLIPELKTCLQISWTKEIRVSWSNASQYKKFLTSKVFAICKCFLAFKNNNGSCKIILFVLGWMKLLYINLIEIGDKSEYGFWKTCIKNLNCARLLNYEKKKHKFQICFIFYWRIVGTIAKTKTR